VAFPQNEFGDARRSLLSDQSTLWNVAYWHKADIPNPAAIVQSAGIGFILRVLDLD